jgi:integrase
VPDDDDDFLLRASHRSGSLLKAGMSTQAISARVQKFGDAIGLDNLSAHDCRHCWATRAARGGSSPFALQEGGGWNSLAMPRRYVDEQNIANDGITLSGDDE